MVRSTTVTATAVLLVTATMMAACAPESSDVAPADLEAFATSYAAAWSSQDPSGVASHYSEDGSLMVNDGEPSVGRAAITATAQSFMTAFPDMVVVLDSLGDAGDRVRFHWTWTGTNTGPGGTGKAVRISGFEEWMFGPDDLIAESRGQFDDAEYQRQVTSGGPLAQWEYDPGMLFPADRSLTRPEDGVALPDGSLLVVDQVHGLRRVEPDGSNAPFGRMVEAGYVHEPPERAGGANGISLEPGGTHVLVADIFRGGIYRVDVTTGEAEQVYQHTYGVNTAVRDSRGAIWFTQSAHNTPEEGEARMWATVDVPAPEGALLRLGMQDGRLAEKAELLVDSLYFANGVAVDEARGALYLSETMGGRVFRYRVDLDSGELSDPTVLAEGVKPDNLELDSEGMLWVALPLANGVIVVDPDTGARHYAFRSVTPEQQEIAEEFARRGEAGETRLELFTPATWDPLPGFVTGVIVGDAADPVYLTGLGNALVKLDR
jgi:sugar lactone lactonase YvrE/ketosteroid isomerase-like protein